MHEWTHSENNKALVVIMFVDLGMHELQDCPINKICFRLNFFKL